MILSFPAGPIVVDDRPVLSDLRMNLASGGKSRIKFFLKDLADNELKEIDIISKTSKPAIEGLGASIGINGTINTRPFTARAAIKLVSKDISLTGKIGQRSFSLNCKADNGETKSAFIALSEELVKLISEEMGIKIKV